MEKAFLCHSSVQKPLVRSVIRYLDEGSYEYDEITFEAGNDVNLEIERTLTQAEIIVLFISNESLQSVWVKKEMRLAEEKYNQKGRHTTLTFLVDENIEYTDDRIPEWLRKNLILRHLKNPKIIAAKIKHAIRESMYNKSDKFRRLSSSFLGRNTEIGKFESFHYQNIRSKNLSFIISGLEGVGRRSFLLASLKHVNVVPSSISEMILFSLTSKNSIEDLLAQLENVQEEFNPDDFMTLLSLGLEDKVNYAIDRINEYLDFNEIVCIVDDGCIIKPSHRVAEWFIKFVESNKIKRKYGLNIVSRYRPNNLSEWPNSLIHIHLEEMNKSDQVKLFNSFIGDTDIGLDAEQSNYIYQILNGFPDQIKYVAQTLLQHGYHTLKNNPKSIQDYSDKRINVVVKAFLDDLETRDILILLSQLDCVSEKMLFKIASDHKALNDGLIKLHVGGAIERTGVSGELIKVSESIGDYVKRSKVQLNPSFQQKLRKRIKESLTMDGTITAADSSELLINIKALIKSGNKINSKYYIPSFVLQAISDLYNNQNYRSVVELAEIVLERNSHDLDIIYQVRYNLCMALAHLSRKSQEYKDSFFRHLQYLEGADYNFVKGFFHRVVKQDNFAQKEFEEAIKRRPTFSRAKRELVTVLLGQDKPVEALKWAKANYEEGSSNPYHIHAYFQCLIRDAKPVQHKALLQKLLAEIQNVVIIKGQTFYSSMLGQYTWIIENDYAEAIRIFNNAIIKGDKVYAPKALHRLATKYGMIPLANSVAKYFEQEELEE
ncbi:toll/interleukin-1 receptor domain-containing protein [Telluribacter sp. SYSU D00476]|uniref:toll/interleukin-1 receptor domain-containing protein n=1 Tax=Telluribacter sp. SYSU D00476 TaxID=2811430 RepID=UPI001FF4F06D|nr:toll/interleukin-1 receptor domain-containing protein [Telluribacter sp. SYSU D00476]